MCIIISLTGNTDIGVIKLIGGTPFKCLLKNFSSFASRDTKRWNGSFAKVEFLWIDEI